MLRLLFASGWCDTPVKYESFGNWTAHEVPLNDRIADKLIDEHGWRVTYMPTGTTPRSFVDYMTEEDAKRVACALHRAIPEFPSADLNVDPYPHPDSGTWKCIVEAVIAEALS